MTPARFESWSKKASLDTFPITEIIHWRTPATAFAQSREFVTVRTRPGKLSKWTPWVLSPGRDCSPFDPISVRDAGLVLRIDKRSPRKGGKSSSGLYVEIIRPSSRPYEDSFRACIMLQRIVCSQPGLPPSSFSLRIRDLHHFLRWAQDSTPYHHIKNVGTRVSPAAHLVQLVPFYFSHEVFVDLSMDATPSAQGSRDSVFSFWRGSSWTEQVDETTFLPLSRTISRDATGAFVIPPALHRTDLKSVISDQTHATF